MVHVCLRWMVPIAVLSLLATAGWGGQQKIVLREHLGRQWNRELLTYPLTFKPGECAADGIGLTQDGAGVHRQLLDVQLWPGTEFVKSARLAFVADLAPLETKTYTFYYYPSPPPIGGVAVANPTDLKITKGEGSVELSTSKFAVRMLLGEKTFQPAAEASAVPGPVVAMRTPNGTWYGGSRLYGPGKLVSAAAELVDAGPAVAGVRVTYTYEGGRALTLLVRLPAGNAQATWAMNVTPYDRDLAVKEVMGAGWNEAAKLAEETAVQDGWELLVSPGIPDLQMLIPHGTFNAKWQLKDPPYIDYNATLWVDVPLAGEPAGQLISLEPWAGWWEQIHQTQLRLESPAEGQFLQLQTVDPGDWVEAAPLGTWASYGNVRMRHKWVPVLKNADGTVSAQFSACSGVRRWRGGTPVEIVTEKAFTQPDRSLKYTEIAAHPWPLNRVKDLVLDWPGDQGTHPRVFFTQADLEKHRQQEPADPALIKSAQEYNKGYGFILVPGYRDPLPLTAYLATGSPELAAEFHLPERLAQYLGNLGKMDTMRGASHLACMYDALADSGLLTPQDRAVRQAQLAYLAYYCADAQNWSAERGYASGNLNMSVAHTLNLGILAATIPEHPLAKEWSKSPLMMMDKWLNENVAPDGEWIAPGESMANYAEVSASMLVVYAAAAKNAGIHNFVDDPRLKKLMLYMGKQYTPPDPRTFKDRRQPLAGSPPVGRGPAYHPVTGLFGVMARATAQSDPEFSATMQWLWLRGGKSTGYLSDRMSGMENFAMDGTLPAAVPNWTADRFPLIGAVLRQGIGTPQEYYVNYVLDSKGYLAYTSESGGLAAIWAKGVPTSVRFGGHGYQTREEIFCNRVSLARDRYDQEFRKAHFYYNGPVSMTDFAPLPRQDYVATKVRMETPRALWHDDDKSTDVLPRWPLSPVAGKAPVDWRRQMLFLKGNTAQEPGYLVFRDTASGGQPTMWQFWTLSDKLGTPEEVQDLPAFLADKPGNRPVDAREIKGNRFTAVGPQGVDVEYYIAAPTDTPRSTLRWGENTYGQYDEYQDLLHLELPGDGAYFVAYYPRLRAEGAPTFATLGGGSIIKVSGEWGADYAFLSADPGAGGDAGLSFKGTAASVQDRKSGVVLSLGAAGEVAYQGWRLQASGPASLRVRPDGVSVEFPPGGEGAKVTLTAPFKLKLETGKAGVALEPAPGGGYTLTVPVGATQVGLGKG